MSVAPTDQYNPEGKLESISEEAENLPKKFKYVEPKAAGKLSYLIIKSFQLFIISLNICI